MDPTPFDRLVARVDDLSLAITQRRAADLACKRGCAACCHVQLTITPIEAESVRAALRGLDPEQRGALRERAGVCARPIPLSLERRA